jgi:hypothetical protein
MVVDVPICPHYTPKDKPMNAQLHFVQGEYTELHSLQNVKGLQKIHSDKKMCAFCTVDVSVQ